MRCPKCGGQDDKVIDSRSSKEGATIRLWQKEPGVFRVEVDPPVPGGEAEFPPWPDPLWVERLEVERPRRARIVKETCPDGSVAAVELRLEEEA